MSPYHITSNPAPYTFGGPSHIGGPSLGSFAGTSLFPSLFSPLTTTGITPPVANANFLCPMASRMLLMAPE